MKHRFLGAVLAAGGLGLLIVVLLGTPDAAGWVLAAWIMVLVAVGAVALGIVLGLRHDADSVVSSGHHPYLTADWVEGAQVFTVGNGAEPLLPEAEPVLERAASGPRVSGAHAGLAAAFLLGGTVEEIVRPGRAAR
jgi:hypothetical protein